MSRSIALPSLSPDGHAGQRIGNNELICRLATGGMAEIFLAVRRGEAGFRKLVVVKRILPQVAQQEDLVARLLEEGKLMAGFSHPAIAQVFDLGRDGEDYFIVMEYVPGVTLRHLMRAAAEAGERLPTGFIVAVGKAVAEALHHAHGHSIIHRDVAPKNLMVSFAGDPKLLDFGVAKGVTPFTRVGMVVGTPSYMSPEQVSGQGLDGRSDEFSLGATLHACLTGKDLFGADNVAAELEAVMRRAVPSTSVANPEVNVALDDVILRALARPREERFPTARDFAR
ncbi:MAG TPA: serine/threonine-protein kinase, partial [Myxococcaceae bacterium]|nr:serine/threonine-protein kinase [Myxococcaceae bacterium]